MSLARRPFMETFGFVRGRSAPFINAQGVTEIARVHEPRFDHSGEGEPRGLLVEGLPTSRRPDIIEVLGGAWAGAEGTWGTVLHEYETDAGELRREAYYVKAPQAAVNACLACKGHHRLIAFSPSLLRNRGGVVKWSARTWRLFGVVQIATRVALDVDDDAPELLLIEG